MAGAPDFVVEPSSRGRDLVITGPWSSEAARVLIRGDANGLVLNYARGFREGTLDLLDPDWGLQRLNLLDRRIADLKPIGRLADSLQELSVQAHPEAELDLSVLAKLTSVAGEWSLLTPTFASVAALHELGTWQFGEIDLHAFRNQFSMKRLRIKDAPYLESLSGIGALPYLQVLAVALAPRLRDIGEVAELGSSLHELNLEACRSIVAIDEVGAAHNLRFLGLGDCGDIASFSPLGSLLQLEKLYAWGSTRVVDGDLSVLRDLKNLRELRMRDRREYSPRVAELAASRM